MQIEDLTSPITAEVRRWEEKLGRRHRAGAPVQGRARKAFWKGDTEVSLKTVYLVPG